MRNHYQPRPGVQPGAQLSTHIRQPEDVHVPTVEQEPGKYIALALLHIRRELARIPAMIADHSKPVDSYSSQSLAPENNPVGSVLNVPAQYETPEIIESVLLSGPPAGTGQIQLGDRYWNVVIPASGILVIAGPLGICLQRTDLRQFTVTATAGPYALEIMGHADTRGMLI